jgi:hypothetical protein
MRPHRRPRSGPSRRALATFYVNEAARLADAATVSQETADAEKLRRWLLDSWGEPFISVTHAAQRSPLYEAERVRKLLAMLQRHGWIFRSKRGWKSSASVAATRGALCGGRRDGVHLQRESGARENL